MFNSKAADNHCKKITQKKYIFVTEALFPHLERGLLRPLWEHYLNKEDCVCVCKKLTLIKRRPGDYESFPAREVYVLNDGAETDLTRSLRAFHLWGVEPTELISEKSMKTSCKKKDAATIGSDGSSHPHVTNEIKERIYAVAVDDVDILITELVNDW